MADIVSQSPVADPQASGGSATPPISPAVPTQTQGTSNDTPPVSDRAKVLYGQLMQNGATQDDLGDLKTFTNAVRDPNKVNKVWDHLTADLGVNPNDLGGKQHFLSVFQPQQPKTFTGPSAGIMPTGTPASNQVSMSPAFSQSEKDQLSKQESADNYKSTQQAQLVSDKLKEIYNTLPSSERAQWNKDMSLNNPQGDISAPSQAQLNHEWFMNSPGGRIVGAIGTTASGIAHSIVDMGKMATLMIGHSTIPGMDPALATKEDSAQNKMLNGIIGNGGVFDEADKIANLGLSQNDIDKAHDIPVLGQAIQLAPIVATEGAGELSGLPSLSKSLFFLQFGGSGINAINDIEKSGVKVDPLVKNLYPYLTGAVGSMFMGNIGETLAGKLPAEAGGKLASAIAADVFMKSAQQDLGADGVSKLLTGTTQAYLEKLEQGSLNIANAYKENIINLAKFDAGNYMAKVAAGQVSAKDPFQDNLGDLTNSLYNTITKSAPMFTGLGMVGSKDLYTMAAPHTGFRNDITSSLIADPSEDNVNNLKQQLTDYGKSQSWSNDQLQGTLNTVDKIATAAKAIPNNVNAKSKDKMVSLLVGRQELKDQYDTYQQQNGSPDPAMQDVKTPEQQTYSNKIDQANDKLKATVMGGSGARVEYKDNESGNPVKTFPDGSSEKITPSRMAMEQNESSAQKTSMFKVKNAPFFNFASSIGATEDGGLFAHTKKTDAVTVRLSPSTIDNKMAYIDSLEVPEETRGLGLAKDKLETITKKADDQNMTLGVHLFDDEGYDKPRLAKLYSDAGFKDQGGDYMERKPNDKENEKSNEAIENGQPEETSSDAEDNEKILPGNTPEAGTEGGAAGVETNAEAGVKNDIENAGSPEETTHQPVEAEDGGSANVNGEGGEASSKGTQHGNESEGSGPGGSDGILNNKASFKKALDEIPDTYQSNVETETSRKLVNLFSKVFGEGKLFDGPMKGSGHYNFMKSVDGLQADNFETLLNDPKQFKKHLSDWYDKFGHGKEGLNTKENITTEPPIAEPELSQLKNQYKDIATKLEKVRKSIELHNLGEKELDDPTLQAKKIQRDRFSRQLTDIEAKISSANDAYYAKVGKPISDPVSAVGVGKMASIDAKIAEVSSRLGKNLRSSINSTGPFQNVGDLVILGKLYIQKGIIKFSDFVAKLREEYKDATGMDLKLTDKEIASQVFKPAMMSMTDPNIDDEDIQERGFGKRMSGNVTETTQNYIDTDPDHDYERQRLAVLKAELENKSEAELIAHMKPLEIMAALSSQDNVAILAAGELLKRALVSDNDLEYQRIFKVLEDGGTTFGQLVRQYGEIKGSDPKFLVSAFEKKLALGGRFMTDEQKQRLSDSIEDYAKKSITAKDLMLRYVDSLDENDNKAWQAAKKEAALAFIKFSRIQADYDMRGFWQTAGSIMKGNLLTPISILKNPLYNLFVNPLMIAGHATAATIDLIASQFGLDRTTTYSLNQVRAELSGFVSGLQTSLRVVKHGVYPGEETKLDSYRGLRPIDAIMQVVTGKDVPKSKNLVQYYKDRFGTKLFEAVFGAPAEANYRLLAIGDRPFYESAYNARLVELAELKKLKGDDYKRFMINPDDKSLEGAKIAGNKATFQHDNMLSKMITTGVGNAVSGLYKSKLAVGGFVADAIAPFVRTPTNVVYSYFKWLVPELHPIVLGMDAYTMFDIRGETSASLRNAKTNGASQKALDKIAADGSLKMNAARREFIGHIGNFMVAVALRSAASWIVSKAVYSGILDPDKKKLGLQYEDSKPNSINIDALRRGIQTGNYSWNANDTYVPLDAFGMFGAAISVQDNINKLEQKDGITLGSEKFPNNMIDNVSYGLPSVVQYSFDQSFLKGTNTMLQALSTGDYSQVAPNIAASMSATVVPNTWSSIARANRELLLNKRPDAANSIIDGKTWEAIKDAIAERAEIHPDLPVKLGMFGTPVRQTPVGRNPYVYQLLDITKFGPVSDDPVVRNVAELYKATGNDEFIPLPPNQNYMIFGDKRILTGEETLKRQKFVGESRYNAYRTVMQTPGYQSADPNIKAIILGNQVLPAATHEGELMFEAYYTKQHPEIGKDIIKVKTGQEPNNGLNKQQ